MSSKLKDESSKEEFGAFGGSTALRVGAQKPALEEDFFLEGEQP